MELTNNTIAPAKLSIGELEGVPVRIGLLVAKATFTFDLRGKVEAESQNPLPVFNKDQITVVVSLFCSRAKPGAHMTGTGTSKVMP